MPDGMLNVKEAAAVAKTSRSLVYEWVKDKLFPVYRRGGRGRRGKIIIPEAEFRAFLETQKVGAGESAPPPASKPVTPPLRHLKLS